MLPAFQWDHEKARANQLKHGVSFEEAASAFADPLSLSLNDPDHQEGEDRRLLLGSSDQGRLLLVVYTERGHLIRLISARRATRHERRQYEEP